MVAKKSEFMPTNSNEYHALLFFAPIKPALSGETDSLILAKTKSVLLFKANGINGSTIVT